MIDGLEHLPNRYLTGEIISELLIESRAKGDQAELEKIRARRAEETKKKEREKERMKEDVKVLQGKLIMLKRFLTENGAISSC
ncbi:hypothetical protein D3C79_685040 [compost metagenome]